MFMEADAFFSFFTRLDELESRSLKKIELFFWHTAKGLGFKDVFNKNKSTYWRMIDNALIDSKFSSLKKVTFGIRFGESHDDSNNENHSDKQDNSNEECYNDEEFKKKDFIIERDLYGDDQNLSKIRLHKIVKYLLPKFYYRDLIWFEKQYGKF